MEEPNCHILMKPILQTSESITVGVPVVDTAKCTLCGKCGEVCRFSAIIVIGEQVLTFPELCHGCGGCSRLCPEKAITEGVRELGVIETGLAGPVAFVQGRLRVGEAMSPPLIRAVKSKINDCKIAILDAPPGASCPVIHTVMGSDFIILVTEPTPFGLHDLRIAVDAISGLGIPLGVILNRSDVGDEEVQRFCRQRGIPLLAEIPHDRRIAEGYARGNLLVDSAPQYRKLFLELFDTITALTDEPYINISRKHYREGTRHHQRQGRHRKDESYRKLRVPCQRQGARRLRRRRGRPAHPCASEEHPSGRISWRNQGPHRSGHMYPMRRLPGSVSFWGHFRATGGKSVLVRGVRGVCSCLPGTGDLRSKKG